MPSNFYIQPKQPTNRLRILKMHPSRFCRKIKLIHLVICLIFIYLYFRSRRSIPKQSNETNSVEEAIPILNPTPRVGPDAALWKERSKEVTAAFRHAWKGYKELAWGKDELLPISGTGEQWFGMGLTIIDSLDTSFIMGEMEIFKEARDWIETSLQYNYDGNSNVFEITIRVVGGLLTSFHLSNDKLFLNKAVELADILLIAFNATSTGIPLSSVNFATRKAVQAHFNNGEASTAEATTLQLEFKYLSHLTGDPKYWNAVQKIMQLVITPYSGL
jgi:endoplasmic reticulum Man9GlcNAc2 1,2-alpha-mannosidase